MKAKRRLSNFDFSGGNAAVALVNKTQGGAANGYKTLISKSTDVVVEMTMAEFIWKFFDVWSGDARFIAKLLGYDDSITWPEEEGFEQKVHLMKSLKEDFNTSGKNEELLKEKAGEISQLVKSLAENSNIRITDLPEEETPKMTTENMIEKSAAESLVTQAVEKALAEKEAEYAEITKSLKEQIAEFEAEKVAVEKAKFVEKAKEYEVLGVEEDKYEEFGVALMKMSGSDEFKTVVEVLEKAKVVAKAASDINSPAGHDLEVEESGNSVMEILKSQSKKKS